MNAEQFNRMHPVGTPVIAYPGVRPEHPIARRVRIRQEIGDRVDPADLKLCAGIKTTTRSVAWELGHGEPVVLVDGYTGGICLTHIDVIERGEES